MTKPDWELRITSEVSHGSFLGIGAPEAWADRLDTPLDPKYPARHSIWTPVADVMQERLYQKGMLRLDTSRLYIRNAASESFKLPMTEEQIRLPVEALRKLLDKYKPSLVLTFGVSVFMIALFAADESPLKLFKTTKLLGEKFRNRIEKYNENGVNIIPLLHVSISREKFLEAHRDFVGAYGNTPLNYFDYVGVELADLLLARLLDRPIWIMYLCLVRPMIILESLLS